jgi:diaminopimelate decarboxylase
MHRFAYRNGELWCEGVRVGEAARTAGTPLYLYSYHTVLDHYRKVRQAFRPVKALVCFALKANSSLAVCRTLVKAGAGFDVVSGGELRRALAAGADPKKIVFASVGKTPDEITQAVKTGLLFFNVESEQELEAIERICRRLGSVQRVSLRLNPDVDAQTHAFITTGHGASKFGIDPKTVESLLRRRLEFPHLRFEGVHLHIGSQILQARPFQEAIRKALSLIDRARKAGAPLNTLNIGGGLGIVYHREKPQTAAEYARAVLPLLKGKGLRIILEPGRFIVGNGGILLTRVLYLKGGPRRRFAIVDAGMNDLVRPSLYGAYHEIQPVIQKRARRTPLVRYDVVGPVCESGDFLAQGRSLPPLQAGDLLAVMGAGAYGFVMSSNYNSRPRAAEVLVRGSRWHLIRRRETFADLTRGEQLPRFLR